MGGLGKEVVTLGARHSVLGTRRSALGTRGGQAGDVSGESGGVAGDVDDSGGGAGFEGFDHAGVHAGPGGVGDDLVGVAERGHGGFDAPDDPVDGQAGFAVPAFGFFDGPAVSDDFMAEREQPGPQVRVGF